MDESEITMGTSCSAHADGGDQATYDLSSNDNSKPKAETSQASDSVDCRNSIEASEEIEEQGSTNQDGSESPPTQTVDPKTLKELQDLMKKDGSKCADNPEHLKKHIIKSGIDAEKLLLLFRSLKAPLKNSVKVYFIVTGQTFGADRAIMYKVRQTWNLNVKITSEPQDSDIIIIFRPVASRVGSDVNAAMRRVTDTNNPVILVVMHHTRDVDYSTDFRRWPDSYPNVVLDVHVLFHETVPGLLTCSRNHQAVKQLQEELKKRSKYRWLP